MSLHLCFLHVELGDQSYRPLAEGMAWSFNLVSEHRHRVTMLTDAETQPFGPEVRRGSDVTRETLMLSRVAMLKDLLPEANGNVICCDTDVRWVKDPAPLFEDDFDVGLMWRRGHPAMPYCGAMTLFRHGSEAAHDFAIEWWFTMATMPKGLHRWWGDQLALASMLGRQQPNTIANFNGCRVKIFDSGYVLHHAHSKEQAIPDRAYAVHFKGQKKAELT